MQNTRSEIWNRVTVTFEEIYFWSILYQIRSVWPDLATFSRRWKTLAVYLKKFIRYLAKFWSYFGKFYMPMGNFLMQKMAEFSAINPPIWSHWTWWKKSKSALGEETPLSLSLSLTLVLQKEYFVVVKVLALDDKLFLNVNFFWGLIKLLKTGRLLSMYICWPSS